MRNINSFLILVSILVISMIMGCENGDPDTCNCTCGEAEEVTEIMEDSGEEFTETEMAEEVVDTEETTETTETTETEAAGDTEGTADSAKTEGEDSSETEDVSDVEEDIEGEEEATEESTE